MPDEGINNKNYMKKIFLAITALLLQVSLAQTSELNTLLKTHVSPTGEVDYAAIKANPQQLNNYINYVKDVNISSWSANKKKAFWMNVYNAFTIKLIVDNYPLKSIMDIKENNQNAWKIPFVQAAGRTLDLNDVEHEVLRKDFDDPRIHVGINCASYSCPPIPNYAFTESNVDAQLEILMGQFINDPKRNKLDSTNPQLSKIFEWFKGDFTKGSTLTEYINRFAKTKISDSANLGFLEYNWTLNKK